MGYCLINNGVCCLTFTKRKLERKVKIRMHISKKIFLVNKDNTVAMEQRAIAVLARIRKKTLFILSFIENSSFKVVAYYNMFFSFVNNLPQCMFWFGC